MSHEEASTGTSGHAAPGTVQVGNHRQTLTFTGDRVSFDVTSLPGARYVAMCAVTHLR